MPAFQPTADQFRAFRDDPYDGPVAQVNLLKFRVKAEYAASDPESGEEISGEADNHASGLSGALFYWRR